ncbi:hypothetical protein [Psychroserpens sp. SPM9]|uniref:hypothetical protein n=1 Tax=Psychroserpens sp. SPM9 TaxID=2975598 RepID=UPI0021A424B6|nr:hypothetical protein [Psychroserpens sp. SPM9]MDG5492533.1 hypothetical protein [Psychroserpens sp. SPM9]
MKNLLNLGTALNRAEQKSILGGTPIRHACDDVPGDQCCYTNLVHITPCPFGGASDSGCWVEETVCTGGLN